MKHANELRPASRLLALAALAALLGGCSIDPVRTENLVPTAAASGKKHSATVSLDASNSTSAPLKVNDDQLKDALKSAITKSQTFSQVVDGKGGRYLLTVNIVKLDQPSFGASMTVKMEAGWTLKRADSGATVWQEAISSTHTTGATESFVGVERVRLATEGAVRANISSGLAKIGQLNL
jgi:hypothetical protein